MKRLFFSLVVMTLLASMTDVAARNVTVEQAKSAAARYLSSRTDYTRLSSNELTLIHQIDNESRNIPAAFIFNAGDWGWIVMGANTAIDAVVAYSDEGNLDMDNMPEPMRLIVEEYADYVIAVQNNDPTDKLEDNDQWTLLLGTTAIPSVKSSEVKLMTEKWDQGKNYNPDYNMYCPVFEGKYSYVGCVATALAQICHYYKYPVQPTGTQRYTTETYGKSLKINYDTMSFNYSIMVDKIIGSTQLAARKEISKLGYAVGVAVKMDYTPTGSGAQSSAVPGAMYKFFKYNRGVMYYRQTSIEYADEVYPNPIPDNPSINWTDIYNPSYGYNTVDDNTFLGKIRTSLMAGQPVYMGGMSSTGEGRDAAGHAWLCSGYNADDESMYFMNWGWNGSGNGFFNLQSNSMYISGHGYNFNVLQECITGIVPPADSLGIERTDLTKVLPAYPNPASYSVSLPYSLTSAATLQIFTVEGKLVESRRLEAGEGVEEILVANMPAGIYIYRLNGASGKFMVQ